MFSQEESYNLVNECRRPADLGLLIVIFLFACVPAVLSGCSTAMRAESGRPVVCAPIEVLISANAPVFKRARLAVLPFEVPEYALGAGKEAADAYVDELLRRGEFSQPVVVSYDAKNDAEALLAARQEGFDLIMKSSIPYLLDGSGALSNHLETSVRIMDVRSGKTLWYLKQKVISKPGPDVDLYWTTISGRPAQRYAILVKAAADQFSDYITSQIAK